MATSSAQGQSTGFVGNVDWADYMEFRPKYPPEFFERIYTQVRKSGGNFGIVNDCGAGGGVASQILAKKFNKVVVSEPNEDFLLWARDRLTPMFSAGKFEFLQQGGEKSSLPDGSMDAVTICEALHWCDIPAAMSEFYRQLKSGGVLCIMHYTYPYLLDSKTHDIWSQLWQDTLSKLEGEIYERCDSNLSRGYEHIHFEEAKWKHVKRVMVNCNGTWKTLARIVEDSERQPSGVGKDDEVIWEEENAELRLEVGLEELKSMYYAMVPWDTEDHKEIWEKLESSVGKGGVFKGFYPATQLIATKR